MVTLSDFHSVSVSGPSQIVLREVWPLRHLIRVMRVYGGLHASRIGLYGARNARKNMMAAVLLKNIYTDGWSGMRTEICWIYFGTKEHKTLHFQWYCLTVKHELNDDQCKRCKHLLAAFHVPRRRCGQSAEETLTSSIKSCLLQNWLLRVSGWVRMTL